MIIRFMLLFILMMSSGSATLAQSVAEQPDEQTQSFEPPPPVYEASLLRLAEVLGSLHFLRGLCDSGDAQTWKQDMEAILAAESPGPLRKSRLIARFNHGFETFHAGHRSCTSVSRRAMALYLQEARRTVIDVRLRYSQ
jgi:uncharacterized protein (TIGR02301 family)